MNSLRGERLIGWKEKSFLIKFLHRSWSTNCTAMPISGASTRMRPRICARRLLPRFSKRWQTSLRSAISTPISGRLPTTPTAAMSESRSRNSMRSKNCRTAPKVMTAALRMIFCQVCLMPTSWNGSGGKWLSWVRSIAK